MEKVSYHNIIAVATGLSILFGGCLMAYLFQKNLFSRYKGKVSNTVEKKTSNLPD